MVQTQPEFNKEKAKREEHCDESKNNHTKRKHRRIEYNDEGHTSKDLNTTVEPENVRNVSARTGRELSLWWTAVRRRRSSEREFQSEEVHSRRGVQYDTVKSKRENRHTDIGLARRATAQVWEIRKALLSVRRMMESGHTMVFSKDGSYILDDRTRESMQPQHNTKTACSH